MSIEIAETRWFNLGIYRVLAIPLRSNPYWPIYRIFRGERFVGQQISMPSVSDAEWHETNNGTYAESRPVKKKMFPQSAAWAKRQPRGPR